VKRVRIIKACPWLSTPSFAVAPLPRLSDQPLAVLFDQVRPRHSHVIAHRPERQHGRHVDQPDSPLKYVNSVTARNTAASGWRSSAQLVLILPIIETATLLWAPIRAIHSRRAEIVISRPMMIIARTGVETAQLDEDDQCCGNHQLVGDRVKEGAKSRSLLPASREIAIEPVGNGWRRRKSALPHGHARSPTHASGT
jgi:hypothetical protein